MSAHVYIQDAGIVCALGADLVTVERNLFAASSPAMYLTHSDLYSGGRPYHLGMVAAELPAAPLPDEDTRNNRMLAAALAPLLPQIEALKARYGAHRIGIVVGTSTSGIAEAEAALACHGESVRFRPDYRYAHQEYSAPARFLSRWLATTGPCWSQSSACTSGGKALASAVRLLRMDVCDAVIAAGVDTLCRMTLAGFDSLSVVAKQPCNPFSRNRNGINLGEGAATFILSRETADVRLAGIGESSDAFHISAPDPSGRGARQAMQGALASAGLTPAQIDYINLHGTGTAQNDAMEALAVNELFGADVPCSSTKPLTGHTLAASGAIEALFCWLALRRNDARLPPHVWDGEMDPDLAALNGLACAKGSRQVRAVLSNSFAFGGNNLSLVMTRE